jgi:glycosyltransferase involved in cell wall biosynthesis
VNGASQPCPLRTLVFLEASTVAGAVKPVLEFARETAASASERRFELTMALYQRAKQQAELIDVVRGAGIPIEVIEERHALDLRALPQLRTIVERLRPDILWTNNTKSHFLVYLSGVDRSAQWIAFHHGYTQEARRTRIYNELDRWSLPRAKRVVTVCQAFASELQRKGVPAERLRILRNPIRVAAPVSDAERSHLRESLGLNDCTVLLSVGRLSQEKGHADLLRAVAQMRVAQGAAFGSRLLMVGDGPERSHLAALCADLKLEDVVHFAGFQPDVRPYYAIANVFVLPSHSEGSPNVLLEAMAAGVPMVATAVGGLPEVLSDEVNALLVPKQDVAELAKAITRLLDDAQLRRHLVEQGHVVVAQHSPQSYFRALSGLFEEVMREAAAA